MKHDTDNDDDEGMAESSLEEEREAIKQYGKRKKKAKNPKLKRSLGHARREEKQHARMFKEVLKRV